MTVTEITSRRGKTKDDRDARRFVELETREPIRRRTPITPFLITVAAVALAALLGWAMWGVYMWAPWTRDATVRAYIVTMAPEVAGRIVELPVINNGYVRKGDLLMVIDPTNYSIAVNQAQAAVQQAQASVENVDAQMIVQQAQISSIKHCWIRHRPCLCSQSCRRGAIRPWRNRAGAPFIIPSSSRPSCISRRRRCTQHKKISIWPSGKSNR